MQRTIFYEQYVIISSKHNIKYNEIKNYELQIKNTSKKNSKDKLYLFIETIDDKTQLISVNKYSSKQLQRILDELKIRTGIECINGIQEFTNIFSKNKNRLIVLSTAIALVFVATTSGIYLYDYVFCPFIRYDNELWLDGKSDDLRFYHGDIIPKPNEVENYDSFKFYICQYGESICRHMFDDYTNNFCLELTYKEENYKAAEKKMLESYTFLEEPVPGYSENTWRMPITETNIGKYHIKIVKYDNYSLPSSLPFIAYNGINTIRYCFQQLESVSSIRDEKQVQEYIQEGFLFEW